MMDIDEAIEYLRGRRDQEMANESTDWSLVDAVDAVLGIMYRVDI